MANFAAIVQSSGSGKTRMAWELLGMILMIPFNLRFNPEWGTLRLLIAEIYTSIDTFPDGLSFPPPDDAIRDHLVRGPQGLSSQAQRNFYLRFFHIVLTEIAEALSGVSQVTDRKMQRDDGVVQTWKDIVFVTRAESYQRVVTKHLNSVSYLDTYTTRYINEDGIVSSKS